MRVRNAIRRWLGIEAPASAAKEMTEIACEIRRVNDALLLVAARLPEVERQVADLKAKMERWERSY